jgi:hypothetical protein
MRTRDICPRISAKWRGKVVIGDPHGIEKFDLSGDQFKQSLFDGISQSTPARSGVSLLTWDLGGIEMCPSASKRKLNLLYSKLSEYRSGARQNQSSSKAAGIAQKHITEMWRYIRNQLRQYFGNQ